MGLRLPGTALVLACVLLAACLVTPCEADLGKYTWGEGANSWWSLTSKTGATVGYYKVDAPRFRCSALSTSGTLLYVVGTSVEAPPGLSSIWSAYGLRRYVFFLVIDGTTGAVLTGKQLVSNNGYTGRTSRNDDVWDMTVVAGTGTDFVYVVGSTESHFDAYNQAAVGVAVDVPDAFIAKFVVDTSQNAPSIAVPWLTQFGTAYADIAYRVASSSSGSDIYVLGTTRGSVEVGTSNRDNTGQTHDVFLIKFSSSGNRGWSSMLYSTSNTPNSVNSEYATAIAVGTGGEIYVASRFNYLSITVGGSSSNNVGPPYSDWLVTKIIDSGGSAVISWTVHHPSGFYNSNYDDQIIGLSAVGSGVVVVGTVCATSVATMAPYGEAPMWSKLPSGLDPPPKYANGQLCVASTFIGKLGSSTGAVVWWQVLSLSADSSSDIATDLGMVPTAGATPQFYMTGYSYVTESAGVSLRAYIKSFSYDDSATTAPAVNEDMQLAPSDFLPSSYQPFGGFTEAVFPTSIVAAPSNVAALPSHPVYVSGFVFDDKPSNDDFDGIIPVAMKLVQTPPPRRLQRYY